MAMTAGMMRYLRKRQLTQARQLQAQRPEDNNAKFYEEFGFVMTPESYEKLTGTLATTKEERDAKLSEIRSAEANLAAAIRENTQNIDSIFSEQEKDFTQVEVYSVNRDGALEVENTYRLPQTVIDVLRKNWDDKGGSWDDETGKYSIRPEYKNFGGDEENFKWTDVSKFDKMLTDYQGQVRKAYSDKLQPKIDEANTQLESQRKNYQDQIDAAKASLSGAKAADDEVLQRYRDEFSQQTEESRRLGKRLR